MGREGGHYKGQCPVAAVDESGEPIPGESKKDEAREANMKVRILFIVLPNQNVLVQSYSSCMSLIPDSVDCEGFCCI